MNLVNDLWFNQPSLEKSEVIALAYPANHTQNEWRAVGGKLFITNFRVIFVPNVIDDKLGGQSLDFRHEQIESLFVKERSISLKELFSGCLAKRLGIRLNDGTEHLFVLDRIEDKKDKIQSVLANKSAEQGGALEA